MRVAIPVLLLALLGACGERDDTPPPPPPAPVTPPRPVLDPSPTGHHNGDSSLDLRRCERTAWSYHGCDGAFPTQGRQWLAWECEHGTPLPLGAASSGDQLDAPTLGRELEQARGGAAPDPAELADYRATVCGRLAEYQIRGVGGPAEREAGLASLERICDTGHRVTCAELAQTLAFAGETERARAPFRRGCEEDPRNSPIMLCANLRDVFAGGLHRWQVTLTSVEGLELPAGQTCTAWVLRHVAPYDGPWIREADECNAEVRCGTRILYGDGGSVCPCREEGERLTAGEDMTTGRDGDPAVQIDTGDGTLVVRDDAEGRHGAFTLRGRLGP